MKIRNVTLEMSLKPFKVMEAEYIRTVCHKIFQQWLPLVKEADQVSVLLWTADGSEILEYQGELDAEVEWARYIGGANPRAAIPRDPEGKALHSRPYLYMENPPVLTYRKLAQIVALLKEVGQAVTGKPVRVGATFDPGPEFAKSPFKYERHNEICFSGTMGLTSFVCCYATLHAEARRYAGFPEGIPEGLPLGTFLGRQSQHFLTDLGFDYIWLSNGFGFGMETWATTGALFDGKEFSPEKAGPLREKILDFWRYFRAECPDFPIETRGTNLSTGMDLASDAVPMQSIYRGGFKLLPPPNSPWAALNGDFGLELVGYLSHIAEVPEGDYPFRYYVHDPWWLNSPWLDRYGREPHDIYLPLATARVDAAGRVGNPSDIQILTIDNSFGETPDQCPEEVIPHLLEGVRHAPDAPGPLVWVYPFSEYHAMTFGDEPRLPEVFYGDWLMRAAVNNGLPLNTVVSSDNLLSSLVSHPECYRESVLVAPAPDGGTALSLALIDWVKQGGRLLLYGPLDHAGPELLDLLNLRLDAPIDGELTLDLRLNPDTLQKAAYPTKLLHRVDMSAGGMNAVQAAADPHTLVAATAERDGVSRVAALTRSLPEWNGGLLAWTRGANSNSYKGGHLLTPDDPKEWFAGDLLMRFLLGQFGWKFAVEKKRPEQRNPITCVARSGNGFFFSGYTPDTTVGLRLRAPQGAPLLLGYETELEDGCSTYRMPRAWRRECRVFVDGQQEGAVSCTEDVSVEYGVGRRLLVSGLKNATLRFYPETGTAERVRLLHDPQYPFMIGDFLTYRVADDACGRYLEAANVTGSVLISW